jgi:ATP dependent DNA ligase domain
MRSSMVRSFAWIRYGRSQFYELMFRRREPFFYAFDLLWLNGEDLRVLSLLERKRRLRKVCLQKYGSASRLLYLDHLKRNGSGLFEKACEFDLEGIVTKWKSGHYVASDRRSSWGEDQEPSVQSSRRTRGTFRAGLALPGFIHPARARPNRSAIHQSKVRPSSGLSPLFGSNDPAMKWGR